MNIGMHIFFWTMYFFRYMARSGVAGSYSSFIFSFLRNLPYCFLQWLYQSFDSAIGFKGKLSHYSCCCWVTSVVSDSVRPHRRQPTDSPPGPNVPGILQARTLEWVAISSSNAWKWKEKVKVLSCVQLLATPWTAAYQVSAKSKRWNQIQKMVIIRSDHRPSTKRSPRWIPSLFMSFLISPSFTINNSVHFFVVVVQSLSLVWLFATPWTAAFQASLSFTISWSLLKLMFTESVMPPNHLIFCCPLLLLPSIFPSIRSFLMSWHFASSGQSTGASASALVLPVSIQGWFPLGWTGLISLQSKGLSRVFSNSTIQKQQFFNAQPSYGPILTSIPDYWKNNSFD